MKRILILVAFIFVAACATETPKETYPYNMTAKEWNNLSIQDQAKIRRDFYFYEKGDKNFVNPELSVEGQQSVTPSWKKNQPAPTPAPAE
ncbi:MAG: hypothetical protein PHE89_00715 [Alphaproteobacteria bacterium]|nr:hypothetical protein [Alphaproteobacteria bacterium]